MVTNIIEIEGDWEQISKEASRYRTQKMRLIILPEESSDLSRASDSDSEPRQFENVVEFLKSLPIRIKTQEDFDRVEREIQEEKNSWGD